MESTLPVVLTLLGLTASSFIATNLDNLLLLVTLQALHPGRRWAVLSGFLVAVVIMLIVAAAGLALGYLLEPGLLGYLGLIPLLLGIAMLYRAWRQPGPVDGAAAGATPEDARGLWVACVVLMLSNSSDSLALMLPLLAETGSPGRWVLIGGYLLMAGVWCALATVLASRPVVAAKIEQLGEKLAPWIMIGVGCYVLLDTPTDSLL